MTNMTFLQGSLRDEMGAGLPINLLVCITGILLIWYLFFRVELAFAGQPEERASGAVPNPAVPANSPAVLDAKVEALFKQLMEGDAFQAARELSSIKEPPVVARLIKILDSSPDESLRGYVINALGDIGDPRAVESLVRMLEDQTGSQPVPEDSVHLEDGVGFISFEEVSGGKVAMRRQNAARALGKIKDERAVEPLLKALDDANYLLAGDAAEALAAIRSSRAVEGLIEALPHARSQVKFKLVVSLGATQDERAILPLIKVFEDDPDKYVRDRAFNALYEFSFDGKPDLASRLGKAMINLYRNGEARDRVLALWFLGRLKIPLAVEVLLEAASSPVEEMREAAAAGLGNIGDAKTESTLEKLAGDPEELVRQAAQKALAKVRTQHD